MNLYKISQIDNLNYDTYHASIVAAPSEDIARDMHPGYGHALDWQKAKENWTHSSWVGYRDQVIVELVGLAAPRTKQGVVLSDFHAG